MNKSLQISSTLKKGGATSDREALIAAHPGHAVAIKAFLQMHDLFRVSEQGDIESTSAGQRKGPNGEPATRVRYLGEYELLDEIARGGMGVVFKARQIKLNRIVALKMIRAGEYASELDIRRFQLEARSAGVLQHPNIVSIHETGFQNGQFYFSMDFIDGPSLSEVVRENPLPGNGRGARGHDRPGDCFCCRKGIFTVISNPRTSFLISSSACM